ncbi:MAG: DUF5667 domain-containing protein, partial [Anaerolineae bacterium]
MSAFVKAIVGTFLLGSSSVATVGASTNSLPGEILYPVKQITEQSRLAIASPEKKEELMVQFANTRIEELGQLIEEGEAATMTLDGIVEVIDDDTIMIG